jgi:type IV pilus assembly protein PilM
MGLFGSKQVVGIDIGHASIKVVGLTQGKNPRVTGCAEVAIDPKYLQKEGLEDVAPAADALKEALHGAAPKPISSREAYISIAESAIFRKVLEVPRSVEGEELDALIRSSIVEYLPDDISLLEIDSQPLPVGRGDNRPVMVVAVSKRIIEQYLAIARQVGLHVHAIDPKPSALARALISPRKDEPIVLVDIGSEMISISLCANQVIWVADTVNIGANILKDLATGEIDQERQDERMNRLVSTITDELAHVMKMYANRSAQGAGGSQPQEVRLTGGGSLIEGIDATIAKEAGIPVTCGKPVLPVPESFDRRFMGALGSALYPIYESL